LSGQGSSTGSGIRYLWAQIGGSPSARINNANRLDTTAELPAVTQETVFTFKLEVENATGKVAKQASVLAKVETAICDGVPAWDSQKTYLTFDEKVSYKQKIYKQNFWNINKSPDTHSAPFGEPWIFVEDCKN